MIERQAMIATAIDPGKHHAETLSQILTKEMLTSITLRDETRGIPTAPGQILTFPHHLEPRNIGTGIGQAHLSRKAAMTTGGEPHVHIDNRGLEKQMIHGVESWLWMGTRRASHVDLFNVLI
jgi:hypothetical protein